MAGPYRSEVLYTSNDTLSVLQSLNRNTFRLMSEIEPTNVSWPTTIFNTDAGEVGKLPNETGYGRFVREYLDGLIRPDFARLTKQASSNWSERRLTQY
jgi:hypothetical protein